MPGFFFPPHLPEWGRGGPLTLPHDGTQVQDAALVDAGPTARSGPGAGLQGEGGSEVQL